MYRKLSATLAFSVAMILATGADAGDKYTIGTARIFTNDYLGDGEDRWRTGAYAISKMRAISEWDGRFPEAFGEMVEWLFRTDILAPSNLVDGAEDDRRYAGTLTFGLHTYFNRQTVDYSLGLDLVAVGPSTGVGSFQKAFHNLVGAPEPKGTLDDQLEDDIMPTISGSASKQIRLNEKTSFSAYAEFRAGDETFARIGVDYHYGLVGQNNLWLRDVGIGQPYRATFEHVSGVSFLLGGDVAYIGASKYQSQRMV